MVSRNPGSALSTSAGWKSSSLLVAYWSAQGAAAPFSKFGENAAAALRCARFSGEINAETAAGYAMLRSELKRAGTPIPANDAWIAALCRQHSLPVLSQDAHFDLVKGIQRFAWQQGQL